MKLIFLILISFSLNAFAEEVCLSGAEQYKEFKDKLPFLFKELPIKLGGESLGRVYDILVTINIKLKANDIVLETESWQGPLGHYKDSVEVSNVCFKSDIDEKKCTGFIKKVCTDSKYNEIVISFRNNAKAFKARYTDNNVILPEITMNKITASQEKILLDKINKKTEPTKVKPEGGYN